MTDRVISPTQKLGGARLLNCSIPNCPISQFPNRISPCSPWPRGEGTSVKPRSWLRPPPSTESTNRSRRDHIDKVASCHMALSSVSSPQLRAQSGARKLHQRSELRSRDKYRRGY